jgi:hypothetical protein
VNNGFEASVSADIFCIGIVYVVDPKRSAFELVEPYQ